MVRVRRRYRHWIDRESALAERLARGDDGRVRADVAECLYLAAHCRLMGCVVAARTLVWCARIYRLGRENAGSRP